MEIKLEMFDKYLFDEGPAALVIREHLISVEGPDGVLFPPTYAPGGGFPGGYNIDGDPNGENVCLIDSVGSQANRIEPLFSSGEYAKLVPQILIKAGTKKVNLLEAGHRAGDAIIRCTEIQQTLQNAFKSLLNGDAEPMARIAPTSLVFGVWDSRDTQVKSPRLIASTIRAYDVRKLTRSATYFQPIDYIKEGLLEEPDDLKDSEGKVKEKHPFSERGFVNALATGSHGGIIATGGIRRDASLGLAALRLLSAGDNEERTLALRRYILGLALTAFTCHATSYLRQGCMLVLNPDKSREFVEVYPTGERQPVSIAHDTGLKYAVIAANAFRVGESKEVEFDENQAKDDLKKAKSTKNKSKKGKKTESEPAATEDE